jgi:hypothetical protein
MQKKNFGSALKLINEARLWPENLGVGKPYDEDIDMRLENWMTYLCDQKMKKTAEANDMLNRIIGFEPKVDNTVRNFFPANALVSAWAFGRLNRGDEAIQFINRQIKYFPNYRLLLWSKAVYEKDKTFILADNEKEANSRIIEQLMSSGL